jgi:MFS family permease
MISEAASRAEKLRRYGLVALAFLHIGVGRGLHGTFGVFFVAMLEAFGWSRATTAGAISLAIVFEGICLPWAGGLIDRIGGRKTLIWGGLVLFAGLFFASTISALWQFYFWIGIVSAIGIALVGMVPHVAIISREFPSGAAPRSVSPGPAAASASFCSCPRRSSWSTNGAGPWPTSVWR